MNVRVDADVLRLHAAMRDLVAVSAIPGAWAGREPLAVGAGLAEALVALLQLDYVFVRLSGPGACEAVDVARGTAWNEISEWVQHHADVQAPRKTIVADVGGGGSGRCRGVVIPLGVNRDGGLVAAASTRSDFPTAIEQLLLSLTANQAASDFRNACLVQERKRAEEDLREARDELETKVAERTAELRLANAELGALHRVATLVAVGVRPEDLFAVVAEEVARVVDVPFVSVARYQPDGTAQECATFSMRGTAIPCSDSLEGMTVLRLVRERCRAARIGDDTGWEPEISHSAPRSGLRSVVGSPIVVGGQVWGAVVASSTGTLAEGTEGRLADFTELVATAIANTESRAALAASRQRIIAASDEARRRIERDLHDGAQQRLLSLALAARAAEVNVPPGRDALRTELSGIAAGLADAIAELQELSRGIHPAILSRGGLSPAIRAIVRRSTIPVDLDITTDERLPEPIEAAAYFVVSEAVANATKHSRASHIRISLARSNARLRLSVGDDGVGEADPARGSGLVGLIDRVEALGGSIRVRSSPEAGTHITAELPLELEPG